MTLLYLKINFTCKLVHFIQNDVESICYSFDVLVISQAGSA